MPLSFLEDITGRPGTCSGGASNLRFTRLLDPSLPEEEERAAFIPTESSGGHGIVYQQIEHRIDPRQRRLRGPSPIELYPSWEEACAVTGNELQDISDVYYGLGQLPRVPHLFSGRLALGTTDTITAFVHATRTSPPAYVPRRISGVPEDYVARAVQLEQRGYADAALDLIYDSVDELLHQRQFALCASLLERVDIGNCSIDVLLGVLTATLPGKSRISTRGSFLRRVEAELRRRGEFEAGLLDGLG